MSTEASTQETHFHPSKLVRTLLIFSNFMWYFSIVTFAMLFIALPIIYFMTFSDLNVQYPVQFSTHPDAPKQDVTPKDIPYATDVVKGTLNVNLPFNDYMQQVAISFQFSLVFVAWIAWHLRAFLRKLVANRAFDPTSAHHLKLIGWGVVAYEFIGTGLSYLSSSMILPKVHSSLPGLAPKFDISLALPFLGLLLVAIGEILLVSGEPPKETVPVAFTDIE